MKDYQQALSHWDRLLEVAPEDPRAGAVQFQRGCAYLWLKDLDQAATCFTRSYELACTQNFFSWAQEFVLWAREWSLMCQAYPDLHHSPLAAIARRNHYPAYISKGVLFFLQKEYQQAQTVLQYAMSLHYDVDWYLDFWTDYWREWDAPFWLAMVYLALDQEEEARTELEHALALEIPPILLKPLTWFEQEKPKLYEQFVKPLLATYGV